jgi:hypothetical protein
MRKIIELQNNYITSQIEVLKIESAQEDLKRQKWDNKISKLWNGFIFIFTVFCSLIYVTLIIAFVFNKIHIPIIEFISVITTPFLPYTINRFIIFISIFKKNYYRN